MDPAAQSRAARDAVLAVRDASVSTLVVTGRDRVSWLNGLLTCDVAKIAGGGAAYGVAVARSGKVLADAVVVVDADRVVVAVPRDAAAALGDHFEHHLVMEDAEVSPDADSVVAWWLHGPRTAAVLDAVRAAGGAGGIVDRTGLGGAFVVAPRGRSDEVTSAIERSASEAGGAVGDDAGWETLRLERGVPRFGVDFGPDHYPQEASIERVAVSFEKGCYLGQEVVFMLEKRGHVKRKIASIVIDAGDPPPRGAAVDDAAGARVGEVTSAATSPLLGKPVALAMIKRAAAEPGTRVAVGGRAGEVVERPV